MQVDPPSPASYVRIGDEVDDELRREVSAWFPRCVDRESGGFHQGFDRQWNPTADWPRFVVFQSRMTWVAAAYGQYCGQSNPWDRYAEHGLAFLARKQWHPGGGGFSDNVMSDGSPWGNGEEAIESTYGASFALYAASRVYRSGHGKLASSLMTDTLAWLENHARDRSHGGFYNAVTRAGKPAPSGFVSTPDETKKPGWKTMNTHLHLLEAYSEAYRAMPSAKTAETLRELIGIFLDRIASPTGTLHQYFQEDWTPLPAADSYGHDIEAAYLLVEAADALGEPGDRRVWLRARAIVDHCLATAYADDGGIVTSGAPDGRNRTEERTWWAQAESLNALLLMHERFGRETDRYWSAFVRQWSFIRSSMIDREFGGWFDKVDAGGRPVADEKGDVWKDAYHNSRALMNVAERLRLLAKGWPSQ